MKKTQTHTEAKQNQCRCTFCGKSIDQVSRMIAGPGAYICNECVKLCNDILDESDKKATVPPTKEKTAAKNHRAKL